MSFTVVVLPEAEQDADRIYQWLAERSLSGAKNWYTRFLKAIRGLGTNPEMWGLAPENEHVEQEIRQLVFKTRMGRSFRVLFSISGKDVQVLHVRGPGQELLGPGEIRQL